MLLSPTEVRGVDDTLDSDDAGGRGGDDGGGSLVLESVGSTEQEELEAIMRASAGARVNGQAAEDNSSAEAGNTDGDSDLGIDDLPFLKISPVARAKLGAMMRDEQNRNSQL